MHARTRTHTISKIFLKRPKPRALYTIYIYAFWTSRPIEELETSVT